MKKFILSMTLAAGALAASLAHAKDLESYPRHEDRLLYAYPEDSRLLPWGQASSRPLATPPSARDTTANDANGS